MNMNLLAGVRILDLTRLYPGPFCTMLLADMGAEVIKIESPGEGDYMREMGPKLDQDSYYFHLLNGNKKSITLNLKTPEGVEVFQRMATKADVIVEGFRPGVVDALGIGYSNIKQINENIIYCSISGYGQDGPYKDRAGHDINYIGLAGILGLTGFAEGQPVIPGVQIGDVGGGSLMAVMAILAALFARSSGKGGKYLDVSMLDGLVSWLPLTAADYFAGRKVDRGSLLLNGGLACYNVYRTADDGYMSLGALEKKFWTAFCGAICRDDLLDRQYQQDQEALKQEVATIFMQKSRKEWEQIFASVDACCEPVLSLHEMVKHPQILARQMIDGSSIGFPVKIAGHEKVIEGVAPRMGEHTEALLGEAGFCKEEIKLLKEKGVI